MLRIFSLSVLESCIRYCLCLFLFIAVRQCYGGRRRARVRSVQMDNIKGLLSIRRIYRVPSTQIRELCGVRKGLDEGILQFNHVERMERDRITKRVCW